MHDGDTEGSCSSSGRGHAPYRAESHPPCFRRTFSVAVYWSAKTQGMIAIRGEDYPRFALVLSGDGVSTRSLLLKEVMCFLSKHPDGARGPFFAMTPASGPLF